MCRPETAITPMRADDAARPVATGLKRCLPGRLEAPYASTAEMKQDDALSRRGENGRIRKGADERRQSCEVVRMTDGRPAGRQGRNGGTRRQGNGLLTGAVSAAKKRRA
ncbi:hypothetical protein CPLU01_15393 [Colletotrichum plurivorum]|uniref:Uncharacterized protein n=1 Tax=Colletotrichum plurivorum TaxID=2175906 RepID=A0A8H6MVP6_9PEZI|nr:hypothetical protein CPLU01_15393 [Colletotrichum plurivorum]